MTVADTRSHRRRWGPALASWCSGVSAFQVALAMGAPWGAVANGISPPTVERAIWVPMRTIGASLVLMAWIVARRATEL